MTATHDHVTDPKALAPGTRMLWHMGSSVVVLLKRKPDDSGWWLADNRGGLDDSVILKGAWKPITISEDMVRTERLNTFVRDLSHIIEDVQSVREDLAEFFPFPEFGEAVDRLTLAQQHMQRAANTFHIDGDRA